MVNFIHHLGWTMIPRYLVKHYSMCFCESVFWRRFAFNLVDFEYGRSCYLMWVGPFQSAEGLQRTKGWSSLNKREFFQQTALRPELRLFPGTSDCGSPPSHLRLTMPPQLSFRLYKVGRKLPTRRLGAVGEWQWIPRQPSINVLNNGATEYSLQTATGLQTCFSVCDALSSECENGYSEIYILTKETLCPSKLIIKEFGLVFCCRCCSVAKLCPTLCDPPWTATCQALLSSTISQSLLKFMSVESVMLSNHLILCHPLLLLPSVFPRIRVFSDESARSSGGQSTGASGLFCFIFLDTNFYCIVQ